MTTARGGNGMKDMRCSKRDCVRTGGPFKARKGERGYVLAWVLILTLVAGLVIPPFLQFMLAGVRASYSYADTTAEYYAADAGIEDALYRIQSAYSTTNELTDDIDEDDDTIPVVSTTLFPEGATIQIGSELIYYTGKSDTEFTGCTRGYGGTTANDHDDGTSVTVALPDTNDVGASWKYTVGDVNGKQVEVSIENRWVLEG
ncbi:MAG: hypothetical protein ACFFCO_13285, partial [Promethearchaeota archaeon]